MSSATFSDTYSGDFGEALYSNLIARNGATISVPKLKSLQGVNVEFDGASTVPFDQMVTLLFGRLVLAGDNVWTFPNLVDATDTDILIQNGRAELPVLTTLKYGSLSLQEGASLHVPELFDIDGANLEAGPGSAIRIPKARKYDNAPTGNSQLRTIQANGGRIPHRLVRDHVGNKRLSVQFESVHPGKKWRPGRFSKCHGTARPNRR